jgi:hypothetical protein
MIWSAFQDNATTSRSTTDMILLGNSILSELRYKFHVGHNGSGSKYLCDEDEFKEYC